MYFGLCDRCKVREATHFQTTVSNGVKNESKFCDVCFNELYGDSDGLYQDIFDAPGQVDDKRCAVCGMSFSEYSRTGLLGCPACYDTFKTELLPQIIKIQGCDVHVGKGEKNNLERDLIRQISDLQERFEAAVQAKSMDEAEALNESIRSLRDRLREEDDG